MSAESKGRVAALAEKLYVASVAGRENVNLKWMADMAVKYAETFVRVLDEHQKETPVPEPAPEAESVPEEPVKKTTRRKSSKTDDISAESEEVSE